jgi:hypothetical protein
MCVLLTLTVIILLAWGGSELYYYFENLTGI